MKTIFNSLILTAISAAALCAPRADIMVRPASDVTARQVVLSDIAVVNCSDKALEAKLTAANVCAAPLVGRSRQLSRDQILVALRRQGVADDQINLLCPAQTTVTAQAATVPGQAIFDAVRDYIVANKSFGGNVEVETVRLPQDAVVPTGSLELRVREDGQKPRKGRSSYPVEVLVDGQIRSTVYVSVNTRVFAPVLVAAQQVQRGAAFDPSNTAVETRDVTMLPDDLLAEMPEDGAVARQAVSAGAVIRSSWVALPSAVHSGDKVTVLVRGERISVSDKGVAAADARLGETVKVKLDGDGREVRGKVVSAGLVEIRLSRRS